MKTYQNDKPFIKMIGWEISKLTFSQSGYSSDRPAVTFPEFFQPIQKILERDPLNSISLPD